jgi:iron-sulfur cluster assembly accessory protein
MITITERAALEAVRILGEQGKPEARVRVWIAGVGCHGFQYGLGIDETEPKPDDKIFESGGVRLVVDPESFTNLDGATLAWVEDPDNQGFNIENPNPAPECGSDCCGDGHEHGDGCGDGECGDGGCCG